ncbi:SNF1-like kinase [Tanacetum coccineum]
MITILKTNTPYPTRKIRRIRACTHQRPQRKEDQYAISSGSPIRRIENIVEIQCLTPRANTRNDRWIDTDSFTEDANASDHQDTTSDVFDGSIIKSAESSMSSNFIYTSQVGGPINKSRAHPREIMTEVLKALQELNVCWKKMGHYNMKCRWDPGSNGMQSNNYFGDELSIVEAETTSQSYNVVKFEV